MNDLQKTELELLKQLIAVCEKLDLTYYLVCGSALGAVKYGGFIPWDDDMDVALPREDYEVFCEKAPSLLPEWAFLQNYKTDPRFPKIFSKLRDSRTTYIETDYRRLDIHHGVFIDVFALDGYPPQAQAAAFEKQKLDYLRKTSCALDMKRSLKSKLLCQVYRFLGYHRKTQELLKDYERLIRCYTTPDRTVMCNYGNFRGKMEQTPREVYGEGVTMMFEGIPVKVPSQYDCYLREKYGDYHEDPPLEEQNGHHYYTVCDLQRPYTDYVKRKG